MRKYVRLKIMGLVWLVIFVFVCSNYAYARRVRYPSASRIGLSETAIQKIEEIHSKWGKVYPGLRGKIEQFIGVIKGNVLNEEFEKIFNDTEYADHGFIHSLIVLDYALEFSKYGKSRIDLDIVVAGALFHDITTITIGREGHSKTGSSFARESLIKAGYPKQFAEAVASVVFRHSDSSDVPPDTLEGKIIHDADKIDSLNVERIVAMNDRLKRHFFNRDISVDVRIGILVKRDVGIQKDETSDTLIFLLFNLIHFSNPEYYLTEGAKKYIHDEQAFSRTLAEIIDEVKKRYKSQTDMQDAIFLTIHNVIEDLRTRLGFEYLKNVDTSILNIR